METVVMTGAFVPFHSQLQKTNHLGQICVGPVHAGIVSVHMGIDSAVFMEPCFLGIFNPLWFFLCFCLLLHSLEGGN